MFCKSCGKQIKGNEKFCSKCGKEVHIAINNSIELNNNKNFNIKKSKFCKYCGNQLKGNENFCSKCGNEINIILNLQDQNFCDNLTNIKQIKFCKSCGKQIPFQASFCSACGTNVKTSNDFKQKNKINKIKSSVTLSSNISKSPNYKKNIIDNIKVIRKNLFISIFKKHKIEERNELLKSGLININPYKKNHISADMFKPWC